MRCWRTWLYAWPSLPAPGHPARPRRPQSPLPRKPGCNMQCARSARFVRWIPVAVQAKGKPAPHSFHRSAAVGGMRPRGPAIFLGGGARQALSLLPPPARLRACALVLPTPPQGGSDWEGGLEAQGGVRQQAAAAGGATAPRPPRPQSPHSPHSPRPPARKCGNGAAAALWYNPPIPMACLHFIAGQWAAGRAPPGAAPA